MRSRVSEIGGCGQYDLLHCENSEAEVGAGGWRVNYGRGRVQTTRVVVKGGRFMSRQGSLNLPHFVVLA